MYLNPIETQRVLIRRFNLDDSNDVHEYTSDLTVMTYIPEGVFTEEQAKHFVTENMGEQVRVFALILKSENKLIGHMYFHPWFAQRTYELGWVLHKSVSRTRICDGSSFSIAEIWI